MAAERQTAPEMHPDACVIDPPEGRIGICMIPNRLWMDGELTALDLRVVMFLAACVNGSGHGIVRPSQGHIARRLGVARASVLRCITRLRERGHLIVKEQTDSSGGKAAHQYIVPLFKAQRRGGKQ